MPPLIRFNKGTGKTWALGLIYRYSGKLIALAAARAPVVDQTALIKALKEKKIKGAALEVFETEPYVPEELTCLPNVVLTPHMGTNTVETNIKMAKEAAKKDNSSIQW